MSVARDKSSQGARVLLVDDHQDTLELMAMVLEGRGHSVRAVANAEDALRLAANEDFDLLISDLGLPDVSGTELLERVHSLERSRGLAAIAMSGYGRPSDIEQTQRAGFAAHLVKPVSIAQLDEAIARVLGSP